MDRARVACADSAFPLADSLLREALAILETKNGVLPEEREEHTEHHEQIAGIYADLFPSEYADKTPESVASMVFQRQLTLSLDSLSLSPDDSARLANLNCRQGVPYNLPITFNERVQKSLFVVVERRKKTVERWIEKALHYLPVMKQLFADSGLPTDLTYLPLIESGFNPRAYSYAHASGIWQFIPSTGRRYGLRMNYWFDERRDPLKSTKAAISYLKKLYNDFGDWYLALAAYNCGENGVARAIARAGTDDYWQLRLPRQTMNYVPQFLAALMVAKNPSCFGLTVGETEPFSLDTVHVSECLDLHTIAAGMDIPFAELKRINPHVRRWCTPPDVTDLALYLPQGKGPEFAPFYATLSEKDKVKWYRYDIRRGDNLGAIASRFGLSVAALKSVNKLSSSKIIAGKHLFVPVPAGRHVDSRTPDAAPAGKNPSPPAGEAAYVKSGLTKKTYRVKPGDTVSEIAERFGVSSRDILHANGIRRARGLRAGQTITLWVKPGSPLPGGSAAMASPRHAEADSRGLSQYTVKKGDNLYTLAKRFNTTVDELAKLNGRQKSNFLIYPGQTLLYRRRSESAGNAHLHSDSHNAPRNAHYTVRKGDNLYTLARRFSIDVRDLQRANGLPEDAVIKIGQKLLIPSVPAAAAAGPAREMRVVYYTVRKGDSLWDIARTHRVSVERITRANQITKDTVLMPGDSIVIVMSEEL
ncbi:MAG: LysM peptidoglycan-binding domain-containing protein [Chitinivibrionales bacterium]|nr:LysM peptidoglycan-binding domain-containing protein [Chitinivibrionales bacterium]MBD3395205.1 LysM peptidoglycan-binding domain-containing protein [Chitinivibrionales bacterium]